MGCGDPRKWMKRMEVRIIVGWGWGSWGSLWEEGVPAMGCRDVGMRESGGRGWIEGIVRSGGQAPQRQ